MKNDDNENDDKLISQQSKFKMRKTSQLIHLSQWQVRHAVQVGASLKFPVTTMVNMLLSIQTMSDVWVIFAPNQLTESLSVESVAHKNRTVLDPPKKIISIGQVRVEASLLFSLDSACCHYNCYYHRSQ